jgi:FlaA1/EpsC-like NDP-sugar epimerase
MHRIIRTMSRFNPRINRNLGVALLDASMAAISFVLSVFIRLGTEQWHLAHDYLPTATFVFTVVCAVVFAYMRLYRGLWRYASMQEMVGIVKAVTLSVLLFAALMFTLTRLEGMPRSVLFINWMLLSFMLGGPRFLYRAMCDRTLTWSFSLKQSPKIPVLLIGAGDAAEQFIREVARDPKNPFAIVGLLDDNPAQKGRTIHRVRIMGDTGALAHVVRKLERHGLRPQKMIVTDEERAGSSMRHLLDMGEAMGIPLARLPRLSAFKQGIADKLEVRPIAVEDLLGRPQKTLDRDSMRALVAGKRVLVTGAGGTIGGELTRQIAAFDPAELILIEASEFNLYHIDLEMRRAFPALRLSIVLCDVRDEVHVNDVFMRYAPQLVFHAAAIKHVPMAEINVEEAVLTNVFGTKCIAEAALKHGAEAMVMISTDKAVNPGNVMGASKRLAEAFCQALGSSERGKTKYITVRFGNVLGSTGSVVPLFSEQLKRGGPITVTHPEITRYFMTVREAVELVLQAAVLGVQQHDRQECIFVLDMGQPVKIYDLAVQMIRLAGLRPDEDIKIVFTGLRPGEKMYEELFHYAENVVKTQHDSISLASPRFADMNSLRQSLDTLYGHCSGRNTEGALALLKQLVPEFTSLFQEAA